MRSMGLGLSAVEITKTALDARAAANSLVIGTLYSLTDRALIVLATATNAYSALRPTAIANVNIYVNASTGSDSNSGYAPTLAFATLQRAWTELCEWDLSTFSATIYVADGNYSAGIDTTSAPVAGSGIYIVGNDASPANVVITSADHVFRFRSAISSPVTIRGMTLSSTGASKTGITAAAPMTITTQNIIAAGLNGGVSAFYSAAVKGAMIFISTNQKITGSMPAYILALGGNVQIYGITVTLENTPAFSWAFAVASDGGGLRAPGVTFSGSATGVRYDASYLSFIVSGAGETYFPGSVNGVQRSGGIYL